MWPNPQKTAVFDTFTEEILNGKLHCAVIIVNYMVMQIRCVKLLIGEGYFIKTESFLVETPLTAEISKISHFLK